MTPSLESLGIDRMSPRERAELARAILESITPEEAAAVGKAQPEVAEAGSAKDQGAESPPVGQEEDFDPEVPGFSVPTSHTVKTVYTQSGRYTPPPLPELDD
jgi:hypothetical protein